MKPLALLILICGIAVGLAPAQTTPAGTPTIPVDQIHEGMHGVAYTVFQGVKPEAMDVEVLGVLHNANGPKGDIILVRLHGEKVEYTGVVAGMSGSPVYFDGKLAGALAFRIGQFSKEPIAGVTPIASMLEINALDRSSGEPATRAVSAAGAAGKTATPGDAAQIGNAGEQKFANLLQPIETPLTFTGFSEAAVREFAPQFAASGIVPVMGAGSASGLSQPEPLEAGSAVSAALVRGDMDIEATCTVTYLDAQRLLACGHPLMQFGAVDLPMNKARVLATLPSPLNAFKIVDTRDFAGAFVQDRQTGILGMLNQQPRMIPVTLTLKGTAGTRQYHYEVLNHPRLSAIAISATVFNVLHSVNEYGEESTYRLSGHIHLKDLPEIAVNDMFAPGESGQPAAMLAAMTLGERFGRIYENSYNAATVDSVDLQFEQQGERRSARLEAAHTDAIEVRPGDEVTVEAVLAPYRGERMVQRIPVRIPADAPKGSLRILVSDGETLNRMSRGNPYLGRKLDLASTVAQINREHSNDRVYVSLMASDPEARIADKVLPSLPTSIMNVMDGMRSNQEMAVSPESSLNETSSATLDYVISGAQLLTVTVK